MATNLRTATPTHSSGVLPTEDCHVSGSAGRTGAEGNSAICPTREHLPLYPEPRLSSGGDVGISLTTKAMWRGWSAKRPGRASSLSLVRYRSNDYSVPVA